MGKASSQPLTDIVRRENMIKEFIKQHKFAVGFFSGIAALPVLIVILWLLMIGKQKITWYSYEFTIPGTDSQLVLHWKVIHPFLAEYDRQVQILSKNQKSPRYWLLTNTGGRHHLNLYMLEIEGDKWIRILDEFSECAINLSTLQGYSIGRKMGKTFVGPMEKGAYWSYSWQNNNPETLEAHVGSAKGVSDTRFDSPGGYLGTLDARIASLRFIPVSEKLEEYIRPQGN